MKPELKKLLILNAPYMVEVPLFAIYTFIIMVTVQPWVIHSLLNIG